jgi:ABC-type polysaccharide/polyol phosphate transport system ATPase subunit
MNSIKINNCSVSFPIFNSRSRGLLNSLISNLNNGRGEIDHSKNTFVHALKNININIKNGERIGLIGPNGSGKSTFLRLCAGIYEPSSGEIFIEGATSSLTDLTLGIDPEATGLEFIKMRAIFMGLGRNNFQAIVDDVANFTELAEFLQLPVRTYSTGMMLRLAFAVSTLINPDILLLDEMIGTGDASFISKANQRLNNFIERTGILILASHNNDILSKFCNRGIVFYSGQIIFDGKIEDALNFYSKNSN